MATKSRRSKKVGAAGEPAVKVFLAKDFCGLHDGRRLLDEQVNGYTDFGKKELPCVIRGTENELHKLFLSRTGKVYGASVEVIR